MVTARVFYFTRVLELRGWIVTETKAQLDPTKAKETVQAWSSQLSDPQAIAVAPLLQALSALLPRDDTPPERTEKAPTRSDAPVSLSTLESLEQTLSQTLELDDPQVIKDSISKCLELVRTEKAKPAPTPVVNVPSSATLSVDAETGLPGRLLFEKIVSDSIADGRSFITALFVVERLPLINKRFGRLAGDRVLLYVAQYLAQELPDSNSLSRWSGAAFSAIINSENSDKMESQIRAISNKPLSANIDVGNRSVMLTISCACMMEQLSVSASPEKLFDKMDGFVETRTNG
jgi:GGDEF domain-containing protein